MTSPVHYPSPGDQYVLMPMREGQTTVEQADVDGARAFAAEQGWRVVRMLGKRDTEGLGSCLIFLAVEADAQHPEEVLAAIEADAHAG